MIFIQFTLNRLLSWVQQSIQKIFLRSFVCRYILYLFDLIERHVSLCISICRSLIHTNNLTELLGEQLY